MSAHTLALRHSAETTATIQMISNLRTLRSKGVLSIAELELATEAALLAIHTAFETYIRELYLECVAGTAAIDGVRSRLRATSSGHAHALIAGDRTYVEWLPVARTLDRALLHLHGGQPFVRLWGRDQVLRHLDLMQAVRNRVAHSGEEALRVYEKKVSRGDAGFARPARWLLHASAAKTNLELMADATLAASADLSSNIRTPQLLGPAVANDGQPAAAGTYRCRNCQRVQFIREWGHQIRPCSQCASATHCVTCGVVKQTRSKWNLEALKSMG